MNQQHRTFSHFQINPLSGFLLILALFLVFSGSPNLSAEPLGLDENSEALSPQAKTTLSPRRAYLEMIETVEAQQRILASRLGAMTFKYSQNKADFTQFVNGGLVDIRSLHASSMSLKKPETREILVAFSSILLDQILALRSLQLMTGQKLNLSPQRALEMSIDDLDFDLVAVTAEQANEAIGRLLTLLDMIAKPAKLPLLDIVHEEAYSYVFQK